MFVTAIRSLFLANLEISILVSLLVKLWFCWK